jgi:hypothetical protein
VLIVAVAVRPHSGHITSRSAQNGAEFGGGDRGLDGRAVEVLEVIDCRWGGAQMTMALSLSQQASC